MEQEERKGGIMRNSITIVVILLLVATFCYAQVARNPEYNRIGKTNFANIGATGLDVTGNPGYIELRGVQTSDSRISHNNYYLWVDNEHNLRIASQVTISAHASFPEGDWRLPNFYLGTVVGTQS